MARSDNRAVDELCGLCLYLPQRLSPSSGSGHLLSEPINEMKGCSENTGEIPCHPHAHQRLYQIHCVSLAKGC